MKDGVRKFFFLVSLGLLAAAGSYAASLTFTGLSTNELVLNYYNGGFGSLGSGPGPANGIAFDPNFRVLSTGVYGSSTDRAVSVLAGGATFNDSAAISGPFSFYYKDFAPGSSAVLYSGMNGTGTVINTLQFIPSTTFQAAGAVLNGDAHSVVFSGPGTIGVVTFGALVIPEPGALPLTLMGVGLLFLVGASGWKKRIRLCGDECRPAR